MAKAYLFTNSLCNSSIKTLINDNDYIIGVDGGINTLDQINLQPHVIIGDFDSVDLDNRFLSLNIKKIVHEPEKDFTDTELAINYALEQKFSPLIIVNNMQDRIDHVLGVIASLRHLQRIGVEAMILGDKQLFMILKRSNKFNLPIKTTVSLIPLTNKVTGISTQGLYYPLSNEELTCDRARGVSNEVSEKIVEINLREGQLLFVVNFENYEEIKPLIKWVDSPI